MNPKHKKQKSHQDISQSNYSKPAMKTNIFTAARGKKRHVIYKGTKMRTTDFLTQTMRTARQWINIFKIQNKTKPKILHPVKISSK